MKEKRQMQRSGIVSAIVAAIVLVTAGTASGPARAATVATDSSQVHGWIVSVHDDTLNLKLRDGHQEKIDIAVARAKHHTGVLPIGGAVVVYGSRGSNGVFHAVSVGHTNPDSKGWPPDA
jgi:hypothetical protein